MIKLLAPEAAEMSVKVLVVLSLIALASASPTPHNRLPPPTIQLGGTIDVGSCDLGVGLGSLMKNIIGSKHTARKSLNTILAMKIKDWNSYCDFSMQVLISLCDSVEASYKGLGNLISRIIICLLRIIICINGNGGNNPVCGKNINGLVGVSGTASDAKAMVKLYGLRDCRENLKMIINRCTKGYGISRCKGSSKSMIQVALDLVEIIQIVISGSGTLTEEHLTMCFKKISIIIGVIGNSRKNGLGISIVKNYLAAGNKYLKLRGQKEIIDIDVDEMNSCNNDNSPWGVSDADDDKSTSVSVAIGGLLKRLLGVTRLSANLVNDILGLVIKSADDSIRLYVKIAFGLGGALDATCPGLGSSFVRMVAGLLKIHLCFLGSSNYGVCKPGWDKQFQVPVKVTSIALAIKHYGLSNMRSKVDTYISTYVKRRGNPAESLKVIFASCRTLSDICDSKKWDNTVMVTVLKHVTTCLGAVGNSNSKGVGTAVCDKLITTSKQYLEINITVNVDHCNEDGNTWCSDIDTSDGKTGWIGGNVDVSEGGGGGTIKEGNTSTTPGDTTGTTPAPVEVTSPSGGDTTTSSPESDTTPSGGDTTTSSPGGDTTPSGGYTTTSSSGGNTAPSGGYTTTASPGGDTTPSGAYTTTTSPESDTTPSGGDTTTSSPGGNTAPSGGYTTTSSPGGNTAPSGGYTTTASPGGDTTPSGAYTTTSSPESDTTPSGGDTTTSSPGGNTAPSGGYTTTSSPGGNTAPSGGYTTTASPGGDTTPSGGYITTSSPGGDTTPSGGDTTTSSPGGETSPCEGDTTTSSNGGDTTPSEGYTTTASPGGDTTPSGGYTTTSSPGGDTTPSGGDITTTSSGGDNDDDCGAIIGGAIKDIPGCTKLSTTVLIKEIYQIKIRSFTDMVNLTCKLAIGLGGIIDLIFTGLGSIIIRIVAVIFKIGCCVHGLGDKSICNKEWNSRYGVIGEANTYTEKDLIDLFRLQNSNSEVTTIVSKYTGGKDISKGNDFYSVILQSVMRLTEMMDSKTTITKQHVSLCFVHVISIFGCVTNSYSKGSGSVIIQKVIPICAPYFVKQGCPDIREQKTRVVATVKVGDNAAIDWKNIRSKSDSGDLTTDVKDAFKGVKDSGKVSYNAVFTLEIPTSFDGCLSFVIKVTRALGDILDLSFNGLGSLLARIVGCLINYIVAILGRSRHGNSFVCRKAYYSSFGLTVSEPTWSTWNDVVTGFKIAKCQTDLDDIKSAYVKRKGSLDVMAKVLFDCGYRLSALVSKGSKIEEGDLSEMMEVIIVMLGAFANSCSPNLGKKICDSFVPVCSSWLKEKNYPAITSKSETIIKSIDVCNNAKVPWVARTTTVEN